MRRAHRDEVEQYGRSYDEAVADLEERVTDLTSEWTTWVRRHHPAPDEVLGIAQQLTTRLWERQPQDPDFLRLRPNVPDADARAVMLTPDDVARAVLFVLDSPAHVRIDELVISPVSQT